MTFRTLAAAGAAILFGSTLPGCVAATHSENASLRAAHPAGLARLVAAPAPGGSPFPSLSGDILTGVSPDILAKARTAQSEALTQALAKP
jgi:hypothetical protein